MRERSRLILSVVCNALTAVAEILWMVLYPDRFRWGMLQMYTYLSNFLCLAVCILYIAFALRALVRGAEMPQTVRTLRWITCTNLTLTILCVAFVLSPAAGPNGYYELMLEGAMFFVHTLCPVLTLVPFLLFEGPCVRRGRRWYRDLPAAVLPTVAYILFAGLMNLFRVWHGPYPFLYVWEQPWYASVLWVLFFVCAAAGIAAGLRALSLCPKENN